MTGLGSLAKGCFLGASACPAGAWPPAPLLCSSCSRKSSSMGNRRKRVMHCTCAVQGIVKLRTLHLALNFRTCSDEGKGTPDIDAFWLLYGDVPTLGAVLGIQVILSPEELFGQGCCAKKVPAASHTHQLAAFRSVLSGEWAGGLPGTCCPHGRRCRPSCRQTAPSPLAAAGCPCHSTPPPQLPAARLPQLFVEGTELDGGTPCGGFRVSLARP